MLLKLGCNSLFVAFIPHSCATLWKSFQNKKERLVEQLLDFESKMAVVTTAKAVGLQHAEEKYQTCNVSLWPISQRFTSNL